MKTDIDAVAVLRDRVAELEPLEQGLYAEGFNNCKAIVRRAIADTIHAATVHVTDGRDGEQLAFDAAAPTPDRATKAEAAPRNAGVGAQLCDVEGSATSNKADKLAMQIRALKSTPKE